MYEKYLGEKLSKSKIQELCDTGRPVTYYAKLIGGEESIIRGEIVSKKEVSQSQVKSFEELYGVEIDMFFKSECENFNAYTPIPEDFLYISSKGQRRHRGSIDDACYLSIRPIITNSDAKDNYLKITELEEKILLGMISLSDENNICKATLTDITKEAGLNMVGGIYTYVVRSLVFQGYLEKLNNGYLILDK